MTDRSPRLEVTDTSVRAAAFDDIYFSVHSGLEETRHVFLQGNNLPAAWLGRPRFAVGETGFGTGLNVLALLQLWLDTPDAPELEVWTVEKFPLEKEQMEDLWQRLGPALTAGQPPLPISRLLAVYQPQGGSWILPGTDGRVRLHLLIGDAADRLAEFPAGLDAWFLDGFAPDKNPDLWTQDILSTAARKTRTGGTLASFTAAGVVKTRLRAAGFEIKRRPGHGAKRHMIIGTLCAPQSP